MQSPKITLQLRFLDRDPETVKLGPGRTMVGREAGDILLHDPEASALHAEIEFTKGAVIVRDLGSRNGTWREGQRLPQFALFRGQTFRCGTTDITLVEIEGSDAPVAGGTASGAQTIGEGIDESSTTLPMSPSIAAQTLARGMVVQSSTVTEPGNEASDVEPPPEDRTLVGPAPPLTGPTAPPPGVPVPFGAVPSTPPMVDPFASAPAPMGAPMPASMPAPIPAGVPTPVAAAPSAPFAPVANAVIKLGDAQPKSAKHRAPVDRAARGRLVKRVLLGTLLTAGLIGLVFGIHALLAGRNHAFLRELARELPQDTVGVVALSSPRAVLELLGDEIPSEVREEATKNLGLDPFDPASFESWGFAVDAPMGVALLDGKGMVAISLGVGDPDALRSALASKAAALIKAPEDLRWIERSFGDTPGLWLDEPTAVAALLPGKRVIFVTGGDAEEVARHAQRVAEAKGGETLADRPAFGQIQAEPGTLLLAMYIDGGSGRAAIPGDGMSVMATRMALADLEGFTLMVADDGPRVHLSVQTIMREGMSAVEAFEGVRRKGELLDRIPAPVLAELDGVFATKHLENTLGSSALAWGLAGELENQFRKETGLDLRADLIENLDGQWGWALLELPGKDEGPEAVGMIGYAGLRDQEAAKRTAERFFGKMQDDLKLGLEQVEGTTVYVLDERIRISYFIHEGAAWVAIGSVDLATLIKGSGEPFRSKARIPAIEEATAAGGLMAGFVDLREILSQLRAGLDDDDRADMDEWSPVLGPLEALTLRSELSGRTFVIRWTLHTSSEEALAGLVQGLVKVAGAKVVTRLARDRRRQRCDALVDHILALMRAEAGSASFADELLERRFDLTDECRKDDTTDAELDCMMAAKSLDALTRCDSATPAEAGDEGGAEGGDGITPVDVLGQGEPSPVPYIDDIWPHTSASGTATGRPDATVNYAVALGEDPAVRGPQDALVTIVMFGDFQCPYCKRVLPTLDQLLADDPEVRLVFRHNPLAMHAQAEPAARAALAAGRQGKLWAMADKLYENQHALTDESFRAWADELGLDLVRFDRDYNDSATAALVKADMAAAKKLGATGTPAFFVNGRYLAGAQPLHAFRERVAEERARAERFVDRRGNTRKRLYEDMISHFAPEVVAVTPTAVGTPVGDKRYTVDTSGLPRRGATGFVRVEIVECGDLDCPFCKRAVTTLDQVLTDYEGKVALFWMHNPLAFHAGAEPAARAATAAHQQGKFWEMHDKLIADRTRRSDTDFITYASELGLDTVTFERDLHDAATSTAVTEQQKRCTDNDARGTPTFFINGRVLSGAQPYDKFREVIDQELAGGI